MLKNKITVERWSGRGWYPVMLSPFNSMSEVTRYLKKYSWHFTQSNPYRINDFKPKKQKRFNIPKFINKWNDDYGMVVRYN